LRIASARFAKIDVADYTKLSAAASSTKIFLLPSFATQSPRSVIGVVNAPRDRFVCVLECLIARFKKVLRLRHNSNFPQHDLAAYIDTCDHVHTQSQGDLSIAHRTLHAASVNTSLSSAVSFSFCWCNRNAVQVDSRLAHFDRAISLTGGQHGKESEEGEEDGEEGSEEEEVQEEVRSRRDNRRLNKSASSQGP
jgi:hypothetical protein